MPETYFSIEILGTSILSFDNEETSSSINPKYGKGLCPHSPALLFDPEIIFLLITNPPPHP